MRGKTFVLPDTLPICHYIPLSKPPKNKPLQENKINQYWYI